MKNSVYQVNSQGWVKLVDYMGSDESIEQAARQSYGGGTRRVNETRGLIRYLMRHHHTSPFEMAEVCLQVYVPMDIWRQWVRHRTASINEYSTRYSVAIDESFKTDQWRKQSKSNNQGSDGILLDETGFLSAIEIGVHDNSKLSYIDLINSGVAREQARKVLTLDTFTMATWKSNLHNIFHFLKLRLDNHAQKEIRDYAKTIALIIKQLYPISYEAFEDYVLDSVSLSRMEAETIGKLLYDFDTDKFIADLEHKDFSPRELKEFKQKLIMMQERVTDGKFNS
jgi:thymidylate synthase (FAD)